MRRWPHQGGSADRAALTVATGRAGVRQGFDRHAVLAGLLHVKVFSIQRQDGSHDPDGPSDHRHRLLQHFHSPPPCSIVISYRFIPAVGRPVRRGARS